MKRLAILFIYLAIFSTCTQEEVKPRGYPRVRTFTVENISSEGALFRGEISFAAGSIDDYGFVWSVVSSTEMHNSERISIGARTGKGKFESLIDRSLLEGIKYYVRAYAKSKDYVVYGDAVEFISLGSKAHAIESFEPKLLTWTDTIKITGQRFGYDKNSITVKIDSIKARVVESSDKIIKVILPANFNGPKGRLSISLFKNVKYFEDSLTLLPPEINSFTPSEGMYNTEITIEGKNFNPAKNKVEFGDVVAQQIEVSSTEIKCKVPGDLGKGDYAIKVTSGNQTATTTKLYRNTASMITSISPQPAGFGDIITIKGTMFSEDIKAIELYFGQHPVEVISLSSTELKVKVPNAVNEAQSEIVIKIGGQQIKQAHKFLLSPPVIESITPTKGSSLMLVAIKGKYFAPDFSRTEIRFGDLIPHYVNEITETEIIAALPLNINQHELPVSITVANQTTVSDQTIKCAWAKVGEIPNDVSVDAAWFVIDNVCYIGDHSYNLSTKVWSRISSFPGSARRHTAQFSINGKGYVVGGTNDPASNDYLTEVWEYNPDIDQWNQKNDLPFNIGGATGFTKDNKGYIIGGFTKDEFLEDNRKVWQYDAMLDEWNVKSEIPFWGYDSKGFIIGEEFYYLGGYPGWLEYPYGGAFWKYNINTYESTQLTDPEYYSEAPITFSVDGKGYMGAGTSFGNLLREYDPVTDRWVNVQNYELTFMSTPVVFTYNNKVYTIGGLYGSKSIMEYLPALD